MIADYNISLKLGDDTIQSTLKFHAGDVNGSNLKLHVYNNSKKFNMSGCTAEYDAVIAGHLAESGHAADIDGNTVTLLITKNMTAMDGLLEIDVRILKDGNILGVQTITAHVQRSIIDEETIIDISGTTIGAKLEELDSKKVDKSLTIAGIDLEDDITAEELKAALDIEVSDEAKVFFEIFAPPYYVSDNDYCKVGDIWVDKDISTGQGYRVSVLMSKTYISDPGVYYCSWQPIVPASFNINVLPGGGNLPVHRYSETGGNTEYSYPPYRNGDILTVNGSDYECSVSDGSSYSSTYTYSFKRAVSEADITDKMSLIPSDPTAEEIEAMPSGQLYGDTVNHKCVIKGGQEFYDTEYINNSISKIYTSTQRPPWVTSSKDFVFKEGDIWIYKDPSSLTLKKICVFSGSRSVGGVYKELIWQALYNSDNVIDFVLDPPNTPPTFEEAENFKPYDIGGIQTAAPLPRFYVNDKVRADQYVGSGKDSARYVYECKNVVINTLNPNYIHYTHQWRSPLLTASILSDDFSMSLEPGPYDRIMFPTIARMKELLVENYYDSGQIDTMIGDIESLLAEV